MHPITRVILWKRRKKTAYRWTKFSGTHTIWHNVGAWNKILLFWMARSIIPYARVVQYRRWWIGCNRKGHVSLRWSPYPVLLLLASSDAAVILLACCLARSEIPDSPDPLIVLVRLAAGIELLKRMIQLASADTCSDCCAGGGGKTWSNQPDPERERERERESFRQFSFGPKLLVAAHTTAHLHDSPQMCRDFWVTHCSIGWIIYLYAWGRIGKSNAGDWVCFLPPTGGLMKSEGLAGISPAADEFSIICRNGDSLGR
jgi:hypothetical protein